LQSRPGTRYASFPALTEAQLARN